MSAKGVLFYSTILFCAFVIGQSTKTSLKKSSSKLGIDEGPLIDYLLMVIDNVQNLLVASDPKNVGGYHLDGFANNSADITGSFADFDSTVIYGISNFNVDNLAFEVVSLTGQLQLSWPLLSVVCTYSAEGVESGATITASGDLSISYNDIVLNGTLAFGFNDTALIVTEFALELTHGNSAVELTNLVGSAELQDALQQYVSELTEQIFDALADKFATIGEDDAAEILNPMLWTVGNPNPRQLLEEAYLIPNRFLSKLDVQL